MPARRSSERVARESYEKLLKTAREAARNGIEISPGSEHFYALCGAHMTSVDEIMQLITDEVAAEQEAQTGVETRTCVVCGDTIIKRHKKGRWPIYCDVHSVKDR